MDYSETQKIKRVKNKIIYLIDIIYETENKKTIEHILEKTGNIKNLENIKKNQNIKKPQNIKTSKNRR